MLIALPKSETRSYLLWFGRILREHSFSRNIPSRIHTLSFRNNLSPTLPTICLYSVYEDLPFRIVSTNRFRILAHHLSSLDYIAILDPKVAFCRSHNHTCTTPTILPTTRTHRKNILMPCT